METMHYFITNLQKFSEDTKAVEKLKKYLQDIEDIFPVIEEVFGQKWNDNQINIELLDDSLNDLRSRYSYERNTHVVRTRMYNSSIQNKKYPENLWGCLFHETHHAFLNPIIRNKRDGKIFNGGHKAEVFNYAFMATTYLKLEKKTKIETQTYEDFLSELTRELDSCNRKFRASEKYEYERELPNNTMDIFREYIDLFSMNIENFSKFIYYLKSSDTAFTDRSNFSQDLDKAKKFLMQ